jgi:hypothetical protein
MREDPFGERLEARLRRLDAAVPPASSTARSLSTNPAPASRPRVRTRVPVGIAAALVVVVVVGAIGLRGLGGAPASSVGPSSAVVTAAPSEMLVGPATGHLTDPDRLVVTFSITNATGRSVAFVGASSSAATEVGIYEFPACSEAPGGEPCSGPQLLEWWRIDDGQTVAVSTLVMSGFVVPPLPGDRVPLTVLFDSAPAVTVEVAIEP